ncbi:MAG: Nif3-like dinuclear metal center hexameric protein, partial [Candidatus Thorarchaeota archaeon]
MDARNLYRRLDDDFDLENHTEFGWDLLDLGEHITENFKSRRMGLALDNAQTIHKVYTAVFPSEEILERIITTGDRDILLFTHHPMIWDNAAEGFPFRNIPRDLLSQLEDQRISLFTLHVPLDKNGPYSTTVSLARALGIGYEQDFFEYFGVYVGVIGKTDKATISDLSESVKARVGHVVKTWRYGTEEIANQKVALVAGGGNEPDIVDDIAEAGLNTYITGVTRFVETYEPSIKFH